MNGQTRSVLIVSGDPGIRTMLANHLRFRFNVTVAESAAEALDLLSIQPLNSQTAATRRQSGKSYSMLLTDLALTEMSGPELCSLAVDRDPSLSVVVLSSPDEIDSAIRALRCGAFDYISKPINLTEVTIAVERALLGLPSLIEPESAALDRDELMDAQGNLPPVVNHQGVLTTAHLV